MGIAAHVHRHPHCRGHCIHRLHLGVGRDAECSPAHVKPSESEDFKNDRTLGWSAAAAGAHIAKDVPCPRWPSEDLADDM